MTIFTTPGLHGIMKIISLIILRFMGWKLEGAFPSTLKRCVVVAAPHTSNWDLPMMLLAAFALEMPLKWAGKSSIFRFPFGSLMKWFGGIPIDRGQSHNMVQILGTQVRYLDKKFCLAVAPEGTRKKVKEWKTGFYNIAMFAEVPIVLSYLDYGTKTAGIKEVFFPSGDIVIDMKKIKSRYSGCVGKNSNQFETD